MPALFITIPIGISYIFKDVDDYWVGLPPQKRVFDRLDSGFFGLQKKKRVFDRLDTSAFFSTHMKKKKRGRMASQLPLIGGDDDLTSLFFG